MQHDTPTAPPVHRGHMRPHPWFGLLRGLLFALLPGLQFRAPAGRPDWARSAQRRRRALLLTVAAIAATAAALTPAGTPWPQAVLQTLLFAWVGAGLVTALMGAWVLLRGDPRALALPAGRQPLSRAARTAVIMPICNEDIATVFGGLRATCESLAATGALSLFDIYVLSDTADPALRDAEQRAWERLRTMLGDDPVLAGGRVFYRWRRRRTKRKAGNVADFCRRWGRNYRYMVVLDADSTMHGDTLVGLVRLMEAHPEAGIIQTLPAASGHDTLHARLQQFATRVTGRLFALGMAYWQLGDSHYWGHNAILRVEPFMRHCGLGKIPGRGGLAGEILSHDFVEAALMRRAGYEVWLAPQLQGSWEQYPPNLLAELQRDRRWCQGNLQNARLMAEPGWQPVHRVMFATGALSYAVAPLWLGFVAAGLLWPAPAGQTAALWALTATLLLLPRALGVAAVLLAREQAQFGGTLRLLGGALLEALMAAVQAPLRMLAHSAFVLGALTGLRLEWKSPPREAAAVRWRDAAAHIGLVASAALCGVLLALGDGAAPAWHNPALWPLALPLLLAVPFTVATGSEALGAAVRRFGWLGTPEERRPPRTLARASEHHAFRDLVPAPAPGAPRAAAAVSWRPRAVLAAGLALSLAVMLLPRPGATPGLTPSLQMEREVLALLQTLPSAQPQLDLQPVQRPVRTRPAARIDDSVRQRAADAVARALGEEDYERLIWSLAKAAANAP
ncbi:glucans biosynthesis glucosyltransferase MdoH [Rubrivivax sp. RP6-9]|uniref:glucans biosynthesis glucosyltransferase MdoH n=1 Tax=Rubrivivax sp. RP6-9 TaxID=3415750 RepID=UPI003CC6A596